MNAEDPDNVQPGAQEGDLLAVGKRLAAAREEQSRELTSVASDLHLNSDIVAALERGDESALPAMTFVRGYIKSYARLLGLDEKQLLAMLPATEGYRPAPLKSVSVRRKQLNIPLGKWLFWLTTLAFTAVLLIYGIPVVERLVTKAADPVADRGVLSLPLGEPGQQSEVDTSPVLNEAPESTQKEEALALQEDIEVAPDSPQVMAEEPLVAQEPPVVQETPVVQEEPPIAQEPAAEQAPVTEQVPAAGPAEITLRFSEDSWVEMESHGRKLVVGTQPAGSERTVRAEPPIQLLLGNAPGVELVYRGEVIDLKPHQRGKVARLVLED